jgi:malate dehydrogenase (oxaloacetate-decarboxylating)(NADP+)
MLSGETSYYPEVIRPALHVLQTDSERKVVAGIYAVILNNETIFFADTTVNIDPTAEILAQTAILTADEVKSTFDVEPRIAMLSFSNFGSSRNDNSKKVAKATELVKEMRPDLNIDGEMQLDLALDVKRREEAYQFSTLKGRANVFIFPNLASGNIAYKMMGQLGGAEIIGPILVGIGKPVHVLQRKSDVDSIVRMAAIAVTGKDV